MNTPNKTIDFCESIPSRCIESVLKLPLTYNKNKWFNDLLKQRVGEYQNKTDELFRTWLKEASAQLLDDLDGFIKESLEKKKNSLFPNAAKTINVATVVLGLQTNDHRPTIDMIEEHVTAKTSAKIQVIRLKSNLNKKTNLVNFFHSEVKFDSSTLVIVERIENFNTQSLETLILILHDALEAGLTNSVMLMICMSVSWTSLKEILPPEIMNKIGTLVQYVRKAKENSRASLERLLRGEDLPDLKVGQRVHSFIEMEFFEVDASLMNLKYHMQNVVFEHYKRPHSLLASGKEYMSQIPKKVLTQIFRDAPSVKKNSIKPKENLIDYCSVICTKISLYHTFLTNQMRYYYILLRDEAQQIFPTDYTDIYRELFSLNNLGESSDMADAIERLRKMQHGRVLMRLEAATKDYLVLPDKFDDGIDIYVQLYMFRDRLKKETDKQAVISGLISRLHEHVLQLKSPKNFPLCEAVYYNNDQRLQDITQPSTRGVFLEYLSDKSTPMGILYGIIHGLPETISLADLYGDFVAELNLDADEGLVKVLFLDSIESLQHHGIIKEDRIGKRDSLKRLVWLP